jgi:hypothetical protein
MEEKRNECTILVVRPEGRPRCRWVFNIEIDLVETGRGGMDWIDLAHDRDEWRPFVNTVLNFMFHKMLEYLSSCATSSLLRRAQLHEVR